MGPSDILAQQKSEHTLGLDTQDGMIVYSDFAHFSPHKRSSVLELHNFAKNPFECS